MATLFTPLNKILTVALLLLFSMSFGQATFIDEFSNQAYSNNDGTNSFSSNWAESDEDGGGATGGNIYITTGGNLRFEGLDSGDELSRGLNLSGATSAVLTIGFNSANRGNETLVVQLQHTSGFWQDVFFINSSTASDTQSIILNSSQIHSNSGIRFRSNSFFSWSDSEYIEIDYVRFSTNLPTGSSSAEVKKPFAPRFSENIQGDFTFIANTTMGTSATVPYNGTDGNHDLTTAFIDIDSDPSTFNSSNAEFVNPEPSLSCLNYKKVFLYWAAANKEYSLPIQGRLLKDEPVWDFDKVQLMLPGSSTYQTITADEVIYNGRADLFKNAPIVLVKDITDDVNNITGSPYGTYQVANVKGAEYRLQSYEGSNTGTAGGWQIVFVYESPELDPKNVTIFDGYAHVTSAESTLDFSFSGFQTVPSGQVNADVLIGALEGDRDIDGDQLLILDTSNNWIPLSTSERPSDDFFTSKITLNESLVTNRSLNGSNTLGFDASIFELDNFGNTLIDNDQTEATMRITSDRESYGIFLLGLSIDIYQPTLGPFQLTTSGGTTSLAPGTIVPLSLEIENTGNDDVENLSINFTFPEGIDYVGVTSAPAGYTANYDSASRQLAITIPNGFTDVNDPAYNIVFETQISNSCTSCSDEVSIQAVASFNGDINTTTKTTISSATLDDCEIGIEDPLVLGITPHITINNASAEEGDDLTFTITTSHQFDTAQTFTIAYTNIETTSSDYSGPTSVVLPANSSSVSFNVSTDDDDVLEGDETFEVTISGSSGNITDKTGLGTINDNEAFDTGEGIAVTGFNVNEDAGTADFVISYTGPDVQDAFTVDFAKRWLCHRSGRLYRGNNRNLRELPSRNLRWRYTGGHHKHRGRCPVGGHGRPSHPPEQHLQRPGGHGR